VLTAFRVLLFLCIAAVISLLAIPILWGLMEAAASTAPIDQNTCDHLCEMGPAERGAAAAGLYVGHATLLLPAFLIPTPFTPLVTASPSSGVGWFVRRLALQWAIFGAVLGFCAALMTNMLYSILSDATFNREIKDAFGELALPVATMAFALVGAANGAALAWVSLRTAPRQGNV
jgi:hypothetical protein